MTSPAKTSQIALPYRHAWLLADTGNNGADRLSAFLAEQPADALNRWLWVTDGCNALPSVHRAGTVQSGRQLSRILGDEFDGLVLDWRRGWNTNHLSQAVGALAAGGHLIVLLAAEDQWEQTYGWSPATSPRFFHYWLRAWEDSGAQWIRAGTLPLSPPAKAVWQSKSSVQELPLLSARQQAAESALVAMPGKSRTRLIVTGPRGSGKTTVLAIAANRLVDGRNTVIVTSALTDTLNRLRPVLDDRVHCLPWEQLADAAVENEIVLVDEAAVLGLERLRWLAANADRVAFFSTVEGYEGSGQGFLLRFLPWLRQAGHTQELELPWSYRWAADDPVSVAYRRSTLQPDRSNIPAESGALDQVRRVDPADLLSYPGAPDWVRLLSEAHYQTRPEDIRQCIDDPAVVMWVQYAGDSVVGVLVGLHEPPIEADLADSLWRGKRRPASQLAKQSLISQLGCRDCAGWNGLRIWRLVVHERWRRRGIGRRLIQAARAWTGRGPLDYVAVSYGLTPSLSTFWSANGFHLVRVGTRTDPASGERSALELMFPDAHAMAEWVEDAGTLAGERLIVSVPALEQPLGTDLQLTLATRLRPPGLSSHERHRLRHWCDSEQPDESLVPTLARALWHLLYDGEISVQHPDLWAERLWQGRPWRTLQARHRLSDRRAVANRFRAQVRTVLGGGTSGGDGPGR